MNTEFQEDEVPLDYFSSGAYAKRTGMTYAKDEIALLQVKRTSTSIYGAGYEPTKRGTHSFPGLEHTREVDGGIATRYSGPNYDIRLLILCRNRKVYQSFAAALDAM